MNDDIGNGTKTATRPAIVTGLAYLFLTFTMTLLRAYDAAAPIGKIPLDPGSVFPVSVQWRWHWIQIPLTVVVAVGLFRGWRWARWLALAVLVVAGAISAPLWDVRAAPSYVFVLALNLVICALLFFAPSAKVYFSRSTRLPRIFTMRGAISTGLLVFAVFTAHSIGFAALKKPDAAAMWGSSALFLLPALVFSALICWDLRRSVREIGAALLAVTVALISVQVKVFIAGRAWPTGATLQSGLFQSILLTIVLGISGLTFAAWAVRARTTAAQ
ncbi:hypothetical protein CFB89_20495 [Burkholderia sp. AU16741]|uniref:hypothetical protein n=1 Tax=unclassified Burkholderia TaxID=2613784 RepID=UPI000B7AEAA6|nr:MULTISPECIES: hypothetical protein [unclassified Burkholderia]MDN7429355.1 hypothetical protein [Burkholderia sp. AU45388]OXI29662.1 hypothetical protein CFB89_20495 [Burkholderia sp. AU16741]